MSWALALPLLLFEDLGPADAMTASAERSRGVDGVITDYPARAREVIAQRAEMSVPERLMVTAAYWIGLEPREPPPEVDIG